MTPTKTLIAGEGGIIATNDDLLAERCRIGRNYGNPGDYDCRFVGLNARMSELHAALALASFEDLEERIALRNVLAAALPRRARDDPGASGSRSSEMRTDRPTRTSRSWSTSRCSGCPRTSSPRRSRAEGIETRRYYSPPVHEMRAYRGDRGGRRPARHRRRRARRAGAAPVGRR